jgi:hypothetical protein
VCAFLSPLARRSRSRNRCPQRPFVTSLVRSLFSYLLAFAGHLEGKLAIEMARKCAACTEMRFLLEMKLQSDECRDSIRGMGTTHIIRGPRSVISKHVQYRRGTKQEGRYQTGKSRCVRKLTNADTVCHLPQMFTSTYWILYFDAFMVVIPRGAEAAKAAP